MSYLGRVYDLTLLCKAHAGSVLLKPILANGGKDITHWFNPETKDIKTHIDPITGCTTLYCPMGRFIHVPPTYPRSDWANNFGCPWWLDDNYCIGLLTKKTRKVRIINSLTLQEQIIEVCTEENMYEILQRYLPYNSHAASYTWKYYGGCLDMKKTLDENGVKDESEELFNLRMDEDNYLPPISLYFNNDLTEV